MIQPLLTALEPLAHDHTDDARHLIIQADAALDAVVIERICASSRGAGYPDLLFAVKQTARSH